MKKLGKVSVIVLSLFVAFIAGAFVIRAQNEVPYGDVFACFSKGKGRLVEGYLDCKPNETLVSWFDNETVYVLGNALIDSDAALQVQLEDEVTSRNEADAALQVQLEDEVTSRNEADDALQDQLEDEVTSRSEADDALQVQVDTLVDDLDGLDTAAEFGDAYSLNAVFPLAEGESTSIVFLLCDPGDAMLSGGFTGSFRVLATASRGALRSQGRLGWMARGRNSADHVFTDDFIVWVVCLDTAEPNRAGTFENVTSTCEWAPPGLLLCNE